MFIHTLNPVSKKDWAKTENMASSVDRSRMPWPCVTWHPIGTRHTTYVHTVWIVRKSDWGNPKRLLIINLSDYHHVGSCLLISWASQNHQRDPISHSPNVIDNWITLASKKKYSSSLLSKAGALLRSEDLMKTPAVSSGKHRKCGKSMKIHHF